ncbi:MAG: SurA N-terminal domain-containing protein [Pseudomonadales bacterium]|nr:SurA N-terminal domain-containing protein [Pseudomonadales bacterium]
MAMMEMRDRAQGRGGKFIVGAIIIVMALFGFGAFTSFIDSDPAMVEINGEALSRNDVLLETQRRKNRILSQMGEAADPSLINDALLQSTVLEQLIDRALILQFGEHSGLAASSQRVDDLIRDIPAFQVEGKFDKELYRGLISNEGHTPVSFSRSVRESLVLGDLQSGLTNTHMVVGWETRRISDLLSQTRDIAYLTFSPELFSEEIEIGEEAIREHYELNGRAFLSDEAADISYVELSISNLMKDEEIKVSEEDMHSQYEKDLAAYESSERRRASHILVQIGDKRSKEEALAIASDTLTRIESGEVFEELAKSLSEDPGSATKGGDLGFVSKGALVPAFETALWSMKVGELSDPVTSEFGVHIIKLIDIQLDEYPGFDTQKTAIEEGLRRTQAEELFEERKLRIEDLAFLEPDSLAAVAEQFGLEILKKTGLKRGLGGGIFVDQALQSAVFSDEVIEDSFNSKTIEIGDSAYWLRADKYYPAEQKALEKVSEEIRLSLVSEAADDKVQEAVGESLELLVSGQGSTSIAAKYGLEWKQISKVKRNQADVPRAVTTLAFNLVRPEAGARSSGKVVLDSGAVAVVTLTSVVDGDFSALTESDRTNIRDQLLRTSGQDDFQALHSSLKASATIER